MITGWKCAVCGGEVDIAQPFTWRCANSTDADRRHAPQLVQSIEPLRPTRDANPFLGFRRYLAVDAFMSAIGITDRDREQLIAGHGFVTTPFERADQLSDALGFSVDGGVWVKDETHNVGGSHKARHLLPILLHLRAAEASGLAPWTQRPPLAIASCGNAAIAAATLAAAVSWPLQVFVPPWAAAGVTTVLREFGAKLVECPRRAADPPGDPCVHRFREAVAGGAIPFSVQGTENAWCHDGGRTIGWEMARHMDEQIEAFPLEALRVNTPTTGPWALHTPPAAIQYVRVDHGRADICVTEQFCRYLVDADPRLLCFSV